MKKIMDSERADHFWSRVNKHGAVPAHRADLGPCWIWRGALKENGYGCLAVAGRPTYAHRFAYTLAVGPIPAGGRVLHKCDNPPCCRPDHLFVGTQQDNLDDAVSKGRIPHGERANNARLTDAQVAAIRALVATRSTISRLEKGLIAEVAGITLGHLDHILSMRSRKAG